MEYAFTRGRFNVHYLTAPYALLVKAFGNDGTVSPRDTYKVTAQWDSHPGTPGWEVYDYKSGLQRHEVTEWHVQGTPEGIEAMLELLKEAS